MASQPDAGSSSPMWLIERELVTLRRNVEQELITGLREQLRKTILETFMEVVESPDLAPATKKKAKLCKERDKFGEIFSRHTSPYKSESEVSENFSRQVSPLYPDLQLREAAGTQDSTACEVQIRGLSDATRVTDVKEDTPGPVPLDPEKKSAPLPEIALPHCVEDKMHPTNPDSATERRPSATSQGSNGQYSSDTDTDSMGQLSDGGEMTVGSSVMTVGGGRARRNSVTDILKPENMRASAASMMSALTQDDKAILQRKGALWALDANTSIIARAVSDDCFDYAMGAVLVVNSIVIGMRVDWEASNLGEADNPIYVWTDRLFCVIFLTELGLRLYTFRLAWYLTEGWQWAYFDTVVVAFQVVEEVVLIAAGDSSIDLGFLKMLKMGRLMRMVRMIRLLPELKSLVLLILASMSAFMWTCFLLMLLTYMLSVYMVMMTVDSLEQTMSQDTALRAEVQLYWGSVGSAVLSCYWCITGGQDWAVIIGPLVRLTGSQVHNVVFAMFVAFATMVLMNLVTGVFVAGAQRLSAQDQDKDLKRMAHKVFRLVDDDCSEELSRTEFNRHMKAGNLDTYLAAVDLDRTSADNLFQILDADHTDSIDVNEFINGCLRLRGVPRSADVAQLLLESRAQSLVHKQAMESLHKHMDTSLRSMRRGVKQLSLRIEQRNDTMDC